MCKLKTAGEFKAKKSAVQNTQLHLNFKKPKIIIHSSPYRITMRCHKRIIVRHSTYLLF